MSNQPSSVNDILDALDSLAADRPRVSLGDAVEAFGDRGYGPVLLLLALLEMSPIGGIPGIPTMLAAIIVLFAVQIAWGRGHLWLPGFLERRSVSAARLRTATGKLRGIARFADRWFHGRLPVLTSRPFVRIAAVAVILLACTVPPLELFPFASTAPMAAIAAFGLALMVRDGLLMLAAMALTGVAIGVGAGMIRG